MILEAMMMRSFTCGGITLGDDGQSSSLSDLDFAASVMVILLFVIIYLILVFVAIYTVLMCNKNNPMWMTINMFIAVMFPSLFLIVHPNLSLSHRGPKSYCDTE